ncbi:LysR family transcriptional regulator [Pseudomonas sp. NPDC085632]|jgi:DNA-binding transcriptional LysR family regulator|uniref:LysR family transcriptional regulator n=1 Tax=Pseudomonas sp. NPDC085632 TaxID=3364429 RepID=UPI0037CAFDB8
MESLNTLNVFVQVADTRSFVAAGRLLGVSASAVGKSIVRIEERLGVRLFHRSTRSITLTAEGELFLERCRRILAELEAAEAELTQTVLTPRGRLKVSLPLVGEPFLPVMAQFKKTYPDVDLDLTFSDRRVDVVEEGYDAVVRSGDSPDSRLTSRRLGSYRMILVGSPEYFAVRGVPQQPSELAQHACIQFRFPNTGKLQSWPVKLNDGDTEPSLPTSMVCNNLEARICFALQGIGIAYLPDFAIKEWLDCAKLVPVLEDCSEEGVFQIMWPSGRQPAPKLRVFIDFLKQHLFTPAQGRDSARDDRSEAGLLLETHG